ncbi:class I SAM-dependent methyltransferase [Desulfatitalea alkaliphila]|uniref:Class I SAM-dependent methyltransferase n=1 Tax=Desulfatitalea alkaliphila TaxID=2929485 RepID=A0AA41ULA2_9BACT|nr:class I SAM-dependent methyltransferase [Desulfatitalea alkaliphila]MCJ8503189.1 class I SAM-dependent methyltransferase [Desulfatitalea alkaliphila]
MAKFSKDELVKKRNNIIAQYGEWTSHNIDLGYGLHTCDKDVGDMWRVDFYKKILRDFHFDRWEQVKMADLGCLEGLFAIEFAKLGAETVGIEGRYTNLVKAQFVKDVIGLKKCTFHQDDVRNFTIEKYGNFDIVLCCGIFYHLDAQSALELIHSISKILSKGGILILDTHIAIDDLDPKDNPFKLGKILSIEYDGDIFDGRNYKEFESNATVAEKEKALWSSLDNAASFWFTRKSLYRALKKYGFDTVYENLHDPNVEVSKIDRLVFISVENSAFN